MRSEDVVSSDDLRSIAIFRELPLEDLERLAAAVRERAFAADEAIFQRGDPGDSVFMILEGSASVTLTNAEGVEYPINSLEAGDVFGEMALLTGEPRSANVRCTSPMRALELDQDGFAEIVRAVPEVNLRLLRVLASRLDRSTVERQAAQVETSAILATLVSRERPPELDAYPGETKGVKQLNETIRKLAASNRNVLLLGEAGTGKQLVGKLLHWSGSRKGKPFFSMDCSHAQPVVRETAGDMGSGGAELLANAAQQAALFGHEPHGTAYAKGTRRGYLELGHGGTLHLQRVHALTAETQAMLLGYLRTRSFTRLGSSRPQQSDVRIVATSSADLEACVAAGTFDPELLRLLSEERIKLTPLRERKKDIPVVAELMREQSTKIHDKRIAGFRKDAMNALVSYDWPLNLDELRAVVDRAVAICEGDEIEDEHIFLDVARSFSNEGKVNLRRFAEVERVVTHALFPEALRFVTVPLFLALVLLLLLGPVDDNPVNIVAWGVLWPVLLVQVALSARSWCGYCPMSALGSALIIGRKRFVALPAVVKKHGIWFGMAGFVLIVWIERALDMMRDARATGVLLLAILSGALVSSVVFGRRVWCLHLCPLGRAVAQLAAISPVELRGNGNVCGTQCRTHDCAKDGNCPMGLHPSSDKTRSDCVLCLSCVKRCKHKSVHLDLVTPRQKIRAMGKWELPKALFIVLLAASVVAVKLPGWVASHGSLAELVPPVLYAGPLPLDLAVYLAVVFAYAGAAWLASAIAGRERRADDFAHAGHAYLPLAFFGLFNIYFRELVSHGEEILPLTVKLTGLERWVSPASVTPELGTLTAVIPLATLAGGAFSAYLLREVNRVRPAPAPSYRAHQVLIAVTAAVYLLLL